MARYTLDRLVGEGGMAKVFRARAEGQNGFARTCAVKRLLPELARDGAVQARFIDEARIAARLHHPCIVDVFDFYEERGVHHLVMEFVEGASVEHLVQCGLAGRFVPVPIVCRIALDVARALEYAHGQGVLHRDVSCCNVLVSREGEVKLADFGLADAGRRVSSTDPGSIAGKSLYMSPQRRRGEQARPGDDLYALGVVLARLLDASDPRERARAAGQHLRALQRRLVHEQPERRFPSAAALVQELRLSQPAPAEQVAEFVRDNPQPRAPTPPPEVRRRLSLDLLEDTTDSGRAGRHASDQASDAPTQPAHPVIPTTPRTLPEAAIVPLALGDDSDDTTEESATMRASPAHGLRAFLQRPLVRAVLIGTACALVVFGAIVALAEPRPGPQASGREGAARGPQTHTEARPRVLDTSTE